jgi:hypothetical protein
MAKGPNTQQVHDQSLRRLEEKIDSLIDDETTKLKRSIESEKYPFLTQKDLDGLASKYQKAGWFIAAIFFTDTTEGTDKKRSITVQLNTKGTK